MMPGNQIDDAQSDINGIGNNGDGGGMMMMMMMMNATNHHSGGDGDGGGGMMMLQMTTGPLVERREKILAIVPRITGVMSMVGSFLVAFHILRKRASRGTTTAPGGGPASCNIKSYHWIVLAMSTCDIIASFSYSLGTLPIPPGPAPKFLRPHRYGAHGTVPSCTAQGFGIQFGISVIFLNLLLSIHYISVIRWRMREEQIRRYLLIPGLIATFVVGLMLSVPFIFLKGYNYMPAWCWIAPNFEDCAQDGLTSMEACMDRANVWRNAAYFGPLWFCVILTTLVQLGIVFTVSVTEQRASKWRYSAIISREWGSSVESGEVSSGVVSPLSTPRTASSSNNVRRQSTTCATSAEQRRQIRIKERRLESSRSVAFQSFLYLLSFYVCWIPFTIATNTLYGKNDILRNNYFWLPLLSVTFQPLQGFFNFLVYNHRQIGACLKPMMERITMMRASCHCLLSCCRRLSSETPSMSSSSTPQGAATVTTGSEVAIVEEKDSSKSSEALDAPTSPSIVETRQEPSFMSTWRRPSHDAIDTFALSQDDDSEIELPSNYYDP